MTRTWCRRSSVALALLACGCGSRATAEFATASELPDEKRRAQGIAVDLPSDPPETRDEAPADDGVVALRAPLAESVATRVVRDFLESAVEEDANKLSGLMTPSALLYELGARRGQVVHNAHQAWRHRFRKHEYQELGRKLLFREADVATYRGEKITALPAELQLVGAPPAPSDLVLRVPITSPHLRSERVFGDEIVFWLRRDGEGYVIFLMAEDYSL
jgi:hypothetical protein